MRVALLAIVVLLALAVGVLHLALNFVLFGGDFSKEPRLWGLGLPLAQLFLANCIAYLVLAVLFVAVSRGRPAFRVGVDLLLILVTVATLIGWNSIRRPNPRGLGTWALVLEIALIVFAVVHALTLRKRRA